MNSNEINQIDDTSQSELIMEGFDDIDCKNLVQPNNATVPPGGYEKIGTGRQYLRQMTHGSLILKLSYLINKSNHFLYRAFRHLRGDKGKIIGDRLVDPLIGV